MAGKEHGCLRMAENDLVSKLLAQLLEDDRMKVVVSGWQGINLDTTEDVKQ